MLLSHLEGKAGTSEVRYDSKREGKTFRMDSVFDARAGCVLRCACDSASDPAPDSEHHGHNGGPRWFRGDTRILLVRRFRVCLDHLLVG